MNHKDAKTQSSEQVQHQPAGRARQVPSASGFVPSCLRGSIAFAPRLRASAVRILAFVLLLSVTLTQPALACPNCKDSFAEQGANGKNVARGFYWSILFMMGTPFAILGGFSGYMYLEVRKARRAAAMMNEPRRREDAEVEEETHSSR